MGFVLSRFLSNNAEIAVATKMTVNIKPGSSGMAFELMSIVLSVRFPSEWVTLPPLAP